MMALSFLHLKISTKLFDKKIIQIRREQNKNNNKTNITKTETETNRDDITKYINLNFRIKFPHFFDFFSRRNLDKLLVVIEIDSSL